MKTIKKLVSLDKFEALLYFLIGLISLVAIDLKLFLNHLADTNQLDRQAAVDSVSELFRPISDRLLEFEKLIDPRIIDFIAWTVLGSMVIGFILFIEAIIKSATDEKDLVTYINNPTSKDAELKTYGMKVALRIFTAVGFLVLLRFYITSILPALAGTFFASAISLNEISSIIALFLTPVANGLVIYLMVILLRLFFLKPRLFGAEEEID
ncbi:hypothetical protein KBC51_02585 [Candidatus Saccharibacteria bacterium]|nr:hypothetical protein [Candidatus Saccharibacteria bacterium]